MKWPDFQLWRARDLNLRSDHTTYHCASLIDLYLHTKFHWNRRNFLWTDVRTYVCIYIRMYVRRLRMYVGTYAWMDRRTFETGFIRYLKTDREALTEDYLENGPENGGKLEDGLWRPGVDVDAFTTLTACCETLNINLQTSNRSSVEANCYCL